MHSHIMPHNVVMSLLANTGGAPVKHHPTVQTSTAVIYESFQYLNDK
jgi:hypothetical protein